MDRVNGFHLTGHCLPAAGKTGQFVHGARMLSFILRVCFVAFVANQTVSTGAKKSKLLTINPAQLLCSMPGPPGPPGLPGAPGASGSIGRMGFPGKDGKDGKDGDKGEKGEQGDQGRQGNPGKAGSKGKQGVIGKHGPRGTKGPRGDPGQAGVPGLKGKAGDTGEDGLPGVCKCGINFAKCAFSVAATKSYPKERLPIKFNKVLMNEGGHYNASSGKFVCGIPGIYFFTYDITLANKHLAIGLVHNGQYKIKTFDANTGNYDVASGSTILRLARGDEVWLQIFYSEQNGLFYDPYRTDSLFTGFLIYPDQDFFNKVEENLS